MMIIPPFKVDDSLCQEAMYVLAQINEAIDVELADKKGANATRFSLRVNGIMARMPVALMQALGAK